VLTAPSPSFWRGVRYGLVLAAVLWLLIAGAVWVDLAQ
jgi:hypothetical protein